MKEILITIITLASISVANASMEECINYSKSKDWDNIIKYCPEYATKNQEVIKVLAGAYAYKYDGDKAQKNLQIYVNKFASSDKDISSVSLAYDTLGGYYYFGVDGAKKDIQKGLEYITKGAELGNVIAQEQLGSIYTGGDNDSIPTNILTSYYWYQTAGINGNQKAKKSPMLQKIDAFKKQLPYCIAQGEQLVAQSYIDGKAGLSQDKYQAKKYLTQAIALYKKEDKPSADELKFCPPQKGLDLKSAEKLLAGL